MSTQEPSQKNFLPPFVSYSDIENHHASKFIDAIKAETPDDEEWIATEKIHGCNVSVTLVNNMVVFGRRTAYLGDEGFYQMKEIKERYTLSFHEFDKFVRERLQLSEKVVIRLYGEHFGGYYPGATVKSKPIQKGVCYTPGYELFIFDMAFDNEYHNYDDVCALIGLFNVVRKHRMQGPRAHIRYVPVIHRGSLDKLLKLDTNVESEIYKLCYEPPTMKSKFFVSDQDELVPLHPPAVKPNNIEGYVLKPVHPKRLDNAGPFRGKRAIIKLKSPKFLESSHSKEPRSNTPLSADDLKVVESWKDRAKSYINENRLNNVLSKLTDKDRENSAKVIGLLTSDAFADIKKDMLEAGINGQVCSSIKPELRQAATELVAPKTIRNPNMR